MIGLDQKRRYFLYSGVTDIRKSFDGLSGLVINQMKGELLSGDVFIFLNRRRNMIKLLVLDRSGFVIYYKRLEKEHSRFLNQKVLLQRSSGHNSS